jgi:hypothetical protein
MKTDRRQLRGGRSSPVLVAVLAAMALPGVAGIATAETRNAAPAAAQAPCTAPAWSSGAIYNQGDMVTHSGHQWQANHWMWPGVQPGVSGVPPYWIPWADLGACGSGTTTTTTPGSTTTTTTPGSTTTTTPPTERVDEHFEVTGPWAVATGTASAPGTPGVTLYYPEDLGADGYDHPIITFGNGTGGTCDTSAPTVQAHLASWGYAVVCADSGATGLGTEILAAAEWLADQDGNPSSVFFDKLETSKVGALGGSQGASGAVEAMLQSNGLITSVVGVALVDPVFHIWSGGQPPDFSQVQDPLFLISGTADFLTSQEWQQNYYDEVPGPAAKAALVNVGHNPDGRDWAYTTAWFRYTLEGDQFARGAFVATGGSPPEISADSAWTNWAAKNLP